MRPPWDGYVDFIFYQIRIDSIKGNLKWLLPCNSVSCLWIFVFAFILNKATSDFRGIHLDSRWEYVIKGQLPAQINTATRADFSST